MTFFDYFSRFLLYNDNRGESMRIIEFILLGLILFLIGVTSFYWKKQKKLKKKRIKGSKYDAVEVSALDHQYNDYYEPQIVEVVSSEEYL